MSSTPPISRDGFAYANDSFYAEASNQNRHRRATMPELRELFHPTSATADSKEPVGHWYEAQLLHYGLAPSKSKAVAKSRLLDAVNKNALSVPAHVRKLETDLKKEWLKSDRAAKKKEQSGSKPAPAVKRKRESTANAGRYEVHVSVNVDTKSSVGTSGDMPAKRQKQTATKGNASAASKKKEAESKKASQSPMKQTTKSSGPPRGGASTRGRGSTGRQRGGAAAGSQRPQTANASASASPPQFRKKQTARRSRGSGPGSSNDRHGINKVKHEESDTGDDSNYPDNYGSDNGPGNALPSLGPLGLLNGMYAIESDDLDQWSQFDGDDFSLILCLDGHALWGAYDFGMHSGILHIPNRPSRASDACLEFHWRGRENSEGQMEFGDNNYGWIRFVGSGQIEGMITCCGEAYFTGERISGENETRAPRDARSMRAEWDGYNEWEYERENRERWG